MNLKGPVHPQDFFQMVGPLRFQMKKGIISENYFQEFFLKKLTT